MNEDQFKYQQPYPQYQQPVKPPKGDGIGFGVASLVLGAVSILMFGCCVNYILAIIAIALGIVPHVCLSCLVHCCGLVCLPMQENGIPIIFIRTFMKIFMRNTRMSISLCTMILMNCRM